MKYFFPATISCFFLLTACNSNSSKEADPSDSLRSSSKQHDSAQSERNQAMANITGNMVKAESPDALIKQEQGYALPGTNGGTAQSPINIISSNVQNDPKQHISLKLTGSLIAIENLGHTIQLDFANGSEAIINGQSYELKQFHFHTPSEHLIDGMTFPMEMHIVSKLNDSVKSGGSTFAVVGVLFKIGHENKFLNEFLNSIPQEEGKANLDQQKVNLNDLFIDIPKGETNAYYNYHGSLTTPPFTESVNWIIRKRIFEASVDQILTIEKLEGNNARHVHTLNERKIASK